MRIHAHFLSFYGVNCNIHCPTNCKDNTCNIQSGSCFNCKPGWTGTYCNASKMTFSQITYILFILFISIIFYNFIKDLVWTWYVTFLVWTECLEGWYSVNCMQHCVGHCRDGTTYNHVTGQCDKWCDAEWTGYMCDKCNICK